MAAWALITALIAVLGPLMGDWPLSARTLALSGVMVPLSTLVVMPYLTERLGGWLRGEPVARMAVDERQPTTNPGHVAAAQRDFAVSGGAGSCRG